MGVVNVESSQSIKSVFQHRRPHPPPPLGDGQEKEIGIQQGGGGQQPPPLGGGQQPPSSLSSQTTIGTQQTV